MNFNEACDYLDSLHNLPRSKKLSQQSQNRIGLKKVQFFLNLIGNPEKKIGHYLHVTGTSGKGSVTAYLHAILQTAGKKVGSFYSPHPTYITERWRVNDKFMTPSEFVEIMGLFRDKMDVYLACTPYDRLSFFQITEIIGLIFFARHHVNWVVMEAGMGGRYDTTNLIPHKDAAIITNVGLDHVGIIGRNKMEIAYEKAGIIKKCPTFTMERNKKIRNIFQKEAAKNGGKVYFLHKADFTITEAKFTYTKFIYQNQTYLLSTPGTHQIKNAILCIETMRQLKISLDAIRIGLQIAQQPLRLEIINRKPWIILDGAHNPDKIKTTIAAIKNFPGKPTLHLIVGFSNDKNIKKMIELLACLNPHTVYCTRNTINPWRTVANPGKIQRLFQQSLPSTPSKNILLFSEPQKAWRAVRQRTKNNDLILVTGSIFLSGQLRGLRGLI